MVRLREQFFLWRVVNYQDREAFGCLYNLYNRPLFQYLAFRLGKREDAEDLTAQLFLKTWEYLTKQGKEVRNFRAFVYTLARNLLADFYKKYSLTKTVSIDASPGQDEILHEIPDLRNLFEEQIISAEVRAIGEAMNQIKSDYREVIILRYLSELSVKEIAKILGKTPNATAVLLHRGVAALKEKLSKPLEIGQEPNL